MELLEEKTLLHSSAVRTEARQHRGFPQIAKARLLMMLTKHNLFREIKSSENKQTSSNAG